MIKEPEGRVKFVMPEEEVAIREALRSELRPLFTVSVHTGLRWSEELALEWRDVDFMTGLITVRQSKSGYSRQVPMNSVVRPVLMDLAGQRLHLHDPAEPVFRCPHKQADKFFPAAVERARKALIESGQDGSRLAGYTWHCNRHSFASRLVMAGVDTRTVQCSAVGGRWRWWSGIVTWPPPTCRGFAHEVTAAQKRSVLPKKGRPCESTGRKR